jgi:hypothetical protein
MAIRIKVNRAEFDDAVSEGAVYGKVIRSTVIPVYVELGKRIEYDPNARDDEDAEYRQFSKCTIYYAESDEMLDRGEYLSITENSTVIVYC